MNFVCFKLYVYVFPTIPYSVDRNFVFGRLADELFPLKPPPPAYALKLVNTFPFQSFNSSILFKRVRYSLLFCFLVFLKFYVFSPYSFDKFLILIVKVAQFFFFFFFVYLSCFVCIIHFICSLSKNFFLMFLLISVIL